MNSRASAEYLTSQQSSVARPWTRLFASSNAASGPILRLGLAVVLWPHGAQKLLGWFGGNGWTGTMGFLTQTIGLPAPLAAGLILLEFFGPLFLLAGVAVRPVALGMIGIMLGAIFSVHAPNGFFMNWFGAQKGEGYEYHLLVIAMALALVVGGAGALSFDRVLAGRTRSAAR